MLVGISKEVFLKFEAALELRMIGDQMRAYYSWPSQKIAVCSVMSAVVPGGRSLRVAVNSS
ncbi:hypothetical protein ASG35_12265 [Burkholderia sp. Leaf177]|nr:hypothetical protein ASG35_12265 [Burkholderia sp. Leaf177]